MYASNFGISTRDLTVLWISSVLCSMYSIACLRAGGDVCRLVDAQDDEKSTIYVSYNLDTYSARLPTRGTSIQQMPCAPSNATTVGSTTHMPFFVLITPTTSGQNALPLWPTELMSANASACMFRGTSFAPVVIAAV